MILPHNQSIDFSKIKQAKYIKLGAGGVWDNICFQEGTLRLGYYKVPEDYDASMGKEPLYNLYAKKDGKDSSASNHARQIYDFYTSGPETIWITFSGGRMWWCQSNEEVEFISNNELSSPSGSRLKRTVSGWHDCSINGRVFYNSNISGRISKTAGFKGTICDVKPYEFEYLLRLLQDKKMPKVEEAEVNIKVLLNSVENLLNDLTWEDFEILVDLIFSGSGWRRVSPIGDEQKTIDIELVMPITNERAIVQVKSSTDQKQLNEYIEKMNNHKADKLFYVYHTANSDLSCDNNTDVKLMGPKEIANNVLRAGLVDWLIDKVG